MTDANVDPRAEPGTYEKIEGGYVRTDTPTQGGSAPVNHLTPADAQAIIDASEQVGFPPPPQALAAIEAHERAAAEIKETRKAEAKAEAEEAKRQAGGKAAAAPPVQEPKE